MKIILWIIVLIDFAYGISEKGCHYNDAIFNQKVFHNNACWKCYENLTDRGRLPKVYCLVEHDAFNFTVPGFVIRERCIPFDYRSASISELVQSSLSNEAFHMWIKCCQDANACCEQMIENYQVEKFENTCDSHWDGYNCFEETMPGEIVGMTCPYHMKRGDESKCEYSYKKSCQLSGWSTSDFTQCHLNERMRKYSEWHITLISISLIFCLLPILSFIMYRKYFGKHSKTLVALITFVALRNIFKLTLISMIFIDSSTPTMNSLSCRLVSSLTNFFNSMIYVCIALMTLKLLQILKSDTENWGMFILMSIGLLMSITSTILWAFMMKIYSNKLCWIVDEENHWVNEGNNFIMILIAAALFMLCIYHNNEKRDENVIFTLKIFTVPLILFTLPLILMIFTSFLSCCGWEDFHKFLITFNEFLQSISLCIVFFISPKSNLKSNSYWSASKISSQNSNASLAPSRLSNNRDDALNTWHDVVTQARNSVCYDNDVNENICTAPEPYKNCEEVINHLRKSSTMPQRHTIRHIMLRAKNNSTHIEEISPRKCSTPPLPKVIPNQILDDVQLFDFYYKNLDSIFINDSCNSNENRNSNEITADDKRTSFKGFGKMFSVRSDKQPTDIPTIIE